LRLTKLIKEKWWTKTRVRAQKKRWVNFRGFLGEYKIIIPSPVKPYKQTLSLKKNQKPIKIQID